MVFQGFGLFFLGLAAGEKGEHWAKTIHRW
jgi:hypothetical protein